jgi:FkbM family methyltransferase
MDQTSKERQKLRTNEENKLELKRILDSISAPTLNLSYLQELMKTGPRRKIQVHGDSITIQMLESGSHYQWDINDPRTAVACLVATGVYEPIETKIMKHFAVHSKTIVDVGANIGYYTVELAKLLGPNGQLLSFEPAATSFSQLRKNVDLNQIEDTVKLFQLGLSDSVSQAEIFLPQKSGSSAASLRNLHPEENFHSQTVNTTTLDFLFANLEVTSCDLIKIDVEGGELQVIKGAMSTIKKFKPVIFAELLRKWSEAFSYTPNDVLKVLKNLGYSCWGVSEELREINLFTDTDIETNFLFIHKDIRQETLENMGNAGFTFKLD